MNNISRISFYNCFRPPIDSYSGRLFYRLELGPQYPGGLRMLGAFHTIGRRRACFERVVQFVQRCLLSIIALGAVIADVLYWAGMTFRVKPVKSIGCKAHLANLVSYISLPLLICAMPFGYLPDIDPIRPLRHPLNYDDLALRGERAYINRDPVAISQLINSGLNPGLQLQYLEERSGFLLTDGYRTLYRTILETGTEPTPSNVPAIIFQREAVLRFNNRPGESAERESDLQQRKTIIKMFLWAQAYFYGPCALTDINIKDLNALGPLIDALTPADTPLDRRTISQGIADLPSNRIFSRFKDCFSAEIPILNLIVQMRDRHERCLISCMREFFSMRNELAEAQDAAQEAARKTRTQALVTTVPHFPHVIAGVIAMYWDTKMPLPPFPDNFA